jgi:hypothetical protein
MRRPELRIRTGTTQTAKGSIMRKSSIPTITLAPSRRALLALLVGAAAGVAAMPLRAAEQDKQVTLYKEPQCGCCEGYADYLRKHGFTVSVVPTHDLPLLDEKYGIPIELSPCHISLIGGYVVGGHVPIEIVNPSWRRSRRSPVSRCPACRWARRG